MATSTVTTTTPTPEAIPEPKATPVRLTDSAVSKVREIMATQDPLPAGLRIGVVGGGCSGFQYSMSFENQSGMMDKVYDFDGLKVFLDATSLDVPQRLRRRLRRDPRSRRLQVREPRRQEHLRLRLVLQRLEGPLVAVSTGIVLCFDWHGLTGCRKFGFVSGHDFSRAIKAAKGNGL